MELSPLLLFIVAIAAFLTAVLHGATGVAMMAILSNIIGIKVAIPVMTCALVFSHSSRVFFYFEQADIMVIKQVLIFGTPTIILGAIIFSYLSSQAIALSLAAVLVASFPIKAYARKHKLRVGPKLLSFASSIWGLLAGNVIGPGFFIAPFLLGTGMGRLSFVGTMASITLAMNIIKLSVFGMANLLDSQLLLLGVFIGLITIPGNWVGKIILLRLNDSRHHRIVDILTLIVILNLLYLAIAYCEF